MAAYDQYNPVPASSSSSSPALPTEDLSPFTQHQGRTFTANIQVPTYLSFNWQGGGGTDKTFSCMSHVVLRSNYITFNYRTCSWLEEVTHHSFMNITSSLPSASPPPPTLCLLPNSIHDLLIEVRNNLIKQIPLLFSLHLLLTISRTRKYDCNLQWE